MIGAINTFGTPPFNGRFPTELASPVRDSFVYFAFSSPLLDPSEPNGNTDVYEAVRRADGWATIRRVSPPGSLAHVPIPGGVSSDHLYASTNVGGTLSSMALEGETDYLANPDGTFELTGSGSLGSEPFAQTRWISEGGEHVIFSTGRQSPKQSVWCFNAGPKCEVRQLELEAAPTGTGSIYDRGADGPTHVVSLLPGEVPASAGQGAYYKGVSRDGSTVAFTIEGNLYVRVDNVKTELVAGGDPTFAGLSDDGRYLYYLSGGNIHRRDTEAEEDEAINSSADAEVVNVSADGTRVYFISESLLEIGQGVAGEPNMYVWGGGDPRYVATVAPSDLERTSGNAAGIPALTTWTSLVMDGQEGGDHGPGASSTRTTPDGTVLVFESRAQLTAYDNDGHTEIYRYDDAAESLLCVSCNPAVEPAVGDARLQQLILTTVSTVIHNLSDDGSRVFFETPEALVSGDVDGVNDVYEWRAEGGGSSSVALISSGQSSQFSVSESTLTTTFGPAPNILLSVTPDGKDAAFLSEDVLVAGAGEGGTPAIYDARVNGGFPPPAGPGVCVEEACHPNAGPPAPALPGAVSESLHGSGNVKPRKRRHCRHRMRSSRVKRKCGRKKHRQPHRKAAAASSAVTPAEDPQPLAPSIASGSSGDTSSTGAPAADSVPFLAAGSTEDFGIESVSAEESTTAAAMHPDFTTEINLNHLTDEFGKPRVKDTTEEVSVSLPPGLLGNPQAIPRCSMAAFLNHGDCPIKSQVGVSTILVILFGQKTTEPVYNLEPPHPDLEIARFGFLGVYYPIFIDVKVRTATDYGVVASVHSAPGLTQLLSAKTTFWGNPADSSHDEERLTPFEAITCPSGTACNAPEGKRPSELPPTVFLTNPSRCQPQSVGFDAKSYQLPGKIFSATAPLGPITDCSGLPFEPSFEARPTSHVAGAPTGLQTTLKLPQPNTEDVDSPGTATMREARVTLPKGMQIAAGAANWIGTCSEQQVGFHDEVDESCPDASKLGTATITSPALPRPLQGELFQRAPAPGRQFGLWLTSDDLGLHVKLPGELEPDPVTGRLTAVFGDLPQVPVEEIDLNVWGGPRAPLENPSSCGTYATTYTFSPHSDDPSVSGQSEMKIDQGCGRPFDPDLHAGVTDPLAGHFSPFVFDLQRGDGEQAMRGFELHLPQGELAKLAGVPLCPDEAAGSGSCPQSSRIGDLTAATGAGSEPLWIPQPGRAKPEIFLAGPYQGAPFSIVSEVPAQAGPFDLGVLTVRSRLDVDPETAQATVDADPLPQFFEGVGITYRRLHAVIDRPDFSLNPTNCRELSVTSDVTSTEGAVAHSAARFQVDGCKALKFKPQISLLLDGGTERGDYPALRAVVRARKNDANIDRVSVALPHSEFLAQEHIETICTRKRFAAGNCPGRSVYGKAKAWTPLLDQPLEGPVYLRSSDNPLPDLVVALSGQLNINLVGRIDSNGGGIRTTFESIPDAPVTKFVLKMRGGAKGLLVNSQDVCRTGHRAVAKMTAQNGRLHTPHPLLHSRNCGRGGPGK